jgi:hypothetical protein
MLLVEIPPCLLILFLSTNQLTRSMEKRDDHLFDIFPAFHGTQCSLSCLQEQPLDSLLSQTNPLYPYFFKICFPWTIRKEVNCGLYVIVLYVWVIVTEGLVVMAICMSALQGFWKACECSDSLPSSPVPSWWLGVQVSKMATPQRDVRNDLSSSGCVHCTLCFTIPPQVIVLVLCEFYCFILYWLYYREHAVA